MFITLAPRGRGRGKLCVSSRLACITQWDCLKQSYLWLVLLRASKKWKDRTWAFNSQIKVSHKPDSLWNTLSYLEPSRTLNILSLCFLGSWDEKVVKKSALTGLLPSLSIGAPQSLWDPWGTGWTCTYMVQPQSRNLMESTDGHHQGWNLHLKSTWHGNPYWQLIALDALLEVPCSIPSTHTEAHNYLKI